MKKIVIVRESGSLPSVVFRIENLDGSIFMEETQEIKSKYFGGMHLYELNENTINQFAITPGTSSYIVSHAKNIEENMIIGEVHTLP